MIDSTAFTAAVRVLHTHLHHGAGGGASAFERAKLAKEVDVSSRDRVELFLDQLSFVLVNRNHTDVVVRLFRPHLPDLVSRVAVWSRLSARDLRQRFSWLKKAADVERFEEIVEAFCEVLSAYPKCLGSIVDFFATSKIGLFDGVTQSGDAVDAGRLLRIVRSAHRLCEASPKFLRFIDTASILSLLNHERADIRWYTASVVAKSLRLPQNAAESFVSKASSRLSGEGAAAQSAQHSDSSHVFNSAQIEEMKHSIRMAVDDAYLWNPSLLSAALGLPSDPKSSELMDLTSDDHKEVMDLTSDDHPSKTSSHAKAQCFDSAAYVDICGVSLPRKQRTLQSISQPSSSGARASELAMVESTQKNLHDVALAISEGSPLVLTGSAGCGKTALLTEVARRTGNADDLIRVHLDDQIDSKTLLGTHVCTETPGEFRFQEGTLTRAVREGKWILLEDIDHASFEVISALIPLLERRVLHLPNLDAPIHAASGFQLFGTRTLTSSSGSSAGAGSEIAGILKSLVTTVPIRPPSSTEVRDILSRRCPKLAALSSSSHASFPAASSVGDGQATLAYQSEVDRILRTFEMLSDPSVQVHDHQGRSLISITAAFGTRRITLRDLFKWSDRIESRVLKDFRGVCLTDALREDIFMEAVDCFAAVCPRAEARREIIAKLASFWNLSPERLTFFLDSYKPAISLSKSHFQVGSVALPRSTSATSTESAAARFSHTQHSSRLMERLAKSVLRREPVLLVGETGNGKTAVIQYLAQQTGHRLVVQNLNQQTDSTDILGGFKPFHLRTSAAALINAFSELQGRTFDSDKNKVFMQRLNKAFQASKWKTVVKFIKVAIEHVWKSFAPASAPASSASPASKSLSKRPLAPALRQKWNMLQSQLHTFHNRLSSEAKSTFSFSFSEGALITALREGHWILLDEINLASAETLERLNSLLESPTGSLVLLEKGEVREVKRHPDFRVFASMNPPTDFGKKDLPPSIRSRFSEFFVDDITNAGDVSIIIRDALDRIPESVRAQQPPPYWIPNDEQMAALVSELTQFYLTARERSKTSLVVGDGGKPHFSIRSLVRSIAYGIANAHLYEFLRALYEGFTINFLSSLNAASREGMKDLLFKAVFSIDTQHHNQIKSKKRRKLRNGAAFTSHGGAAALSDLDGYLKIEQFWIPSGELEIEESGDYIITPSVQRRLSDLVRVVGAAKYPILLQGPTSAGKTSLVQYLSRVSGHRCVRINNHEHTDLQEYMGCYVSDDSGQLVFQEGILVEAVRKGFWIILDELNLAPSDILEALNRLLDDNRELLIPETGEAVKPHKHFMLFATQNPPGIYGGRKVLSRAFKNRFVELHFGDIPDNELVRILHERCKIPNSYAQVMVDVMKELRQRRQQTFMYSGKRGFITPRDLFRWADRQPNGYQELAEQGYMLLGERLRTEDEKITLREVLSSHCRRAEVQPDVMYDRVSPDELSRQLKAHEPDLEQKEQPTAASGSHLLGDITWTKSLKRLYTLIVQCLDNNEPVLLVGGTGCGKTTVCQLLAQLRQQNLRIINCHQHTETADFVGGLRPIRSKDHILAELRNKLLAYFAAVKPLLADLSKVMKPSEDQDADIETVVKGQILCEKVVPESIRSDPIARVMDLFDVVSALLVKEAQVDVSIYSSISTATDEIRSMSARYKSLFEWHDGPLVQTMRDGDMLLIDEISLAEDSVIERLNSVLEPSRTLFLAEKGGRSEVEEIVAVPNFRLLATMNPGGDFGKKELSPALRNRFTEIWVPSVMNDRDGLAKIVSERFTSIGRSVTPELVSYGHKALNFVSWFNEQAQSRSLSLRDILSWVDFMSSASSINPALAYVHGCCLVVLDGLGIGTGASESAMRELKRKCVQFLLRQVPEIENVDIPEALFGDRSEAKQALPLALSDAAFGISPFMISKSAQVAPISSSELSYSFDAPTTSHNLMKLLRAMQLPKAILLEGSPGVGKTSIVTALGALTGHKVVRINLSEQTDMMDLLGSDLPVSGEGGGHFGWSDGAFLQAIKQGHWVLLDELNLASQSVLEGLNSVLDHRASVYLPELDKTFACPPEFRVFACQNPVNQGGGRKGLPASFLNRFTKVYLNELQDPDVEFIISSKFPSIERDTLHKMIEFNHRVIQELATDRSFARQGSPWELNLRDIFRWCELMITDVADSLGALSVSPGDESDASMVDDEKASVSATSSIVSPPGVFVDIVYAQRMRTAKDRERIFSMFSSVFGHEARLDLAPVVRVNRLHTQVGRSWLARRRVTSCETAEDIASTGLTSSILQRFRNPMEHLIKCVLRRWPTVLIGPSGSGKSSLLRSLARFADFPLHEFSLTSSVDSTELLGCFEQVDLSRRSQKLLRETSSLLTQASTTLLTSNSSTSMPLAEALLRSKADLLSLTSSLQESSLEASSSAGGYLTDEQRTAISEALDQVSSLSQANEQVSALRSELSSLCKMIESGVIGHFEWIDGKLLTALEEGHWIVLDNVNFCNPSVLDRLNPLLEPDGVLSVNECGAIDGEIRVVKPHENFRVFMTMDQAYGEVSRAMRNRCVEIALVCPESSRRWAMEDVEVQTAKATSDDHDRRVELLWHSSNDHADADLVHIARSLGVADARMCSLVTRVHQCVEQLVYASRYNRGFDLPLSLRSYTHFIRLMSEQLRRGVNLKQAMLSSLEQTYIEARDSSPGSLSALATLAVESLSSVSAPPKSSYTAPFVWPLSNDNTALGDRSSAVAIYENLCADALSQKLVPDLRSSVRTSYWLKVLLPLIIAEQSSPMHAQSTIDYLSRVLPSSIRSLCEESSCIEESIALILDTESGGIASLLRSVFSCELFKSFSDQLSSAASKSGISLDVLQLQSLDLTANESFASLLETMTSGSSTQEPNAELLATFDKLVMWIRREVQSRMDAQRTACFSRDALDAVRSRFQPFLNLVPKLIACIDSLVRTYLNNVSYDDAQSHRERLSFLARICNQRDSLAGAVYSTNFDFSKVQVFWRSLRKSVPDFASRFSTAACFSNNLSQSLSDELNHLTNLCSLADNSTWQVLGLANVAADQRNLKNRLWKSGAHPFVPQTEDLYIIYSRLVALSNCLHPANASSKGSKSQLLSLPSDHPSFFLDARWKRTLTEALCNVKYANARTTSPEQTTTDALSGIPAILEEGFTNLKAAYETQQLSKSEFQVRRWVPHESAEIFFDAEEDNVDLDEMITVNANFGVDYVKVQSTVEQVVVAKLLVDQYSLLTSLAPLLAKTSSLHTQHSDEGTMTIPQSDFHDVSSHARRLLADFVRFSTSSEPVVLAPIQSIAWICDQLSSATANDSITALYRDLQSAYHEALFEFWKLLRRGSICREFDDSFSSSAVVPRLFSSLASQMTVGVSAGASLDAVGLRDRRSKQGVLRGLLEFFCSSSTASRQAPTSSVCRTEWLSIVSWLRLTLETPFAKSLETSDREVVLTSLSNLDSLLFADTAPSQKDASASIRKLVDALGRCSDFRVKSLVRPVIEKFFNCVWGMVVSPQEANLRNLGELWVLLGALRFHLLLPASPVDPTQKYTIRLADIRSRREELQWEIELREWSEKLSTGRETNARIDALEEDLEKLDEEASSCESRVRFRPSNSTATFVDLFRELSDATLKSSGGGMDVGVGTISGILSQPAMMKENAPKLLDSVSSLSTTLKEKFAHFADFIQPIVVSLEHIAYGLELATLPDSYSRAISVVRTPSLSLGEHDPIFVTLSALLSYPSPQVTQDVLRGRQSSGALTPAFKTMSLASSSAVAQPRSVDLNMIERLVSSDTMAFTSLRVPLLVCNLSQTFVDCVSRRSSPSSSLDRSLLTNIDACFRALLDTWRRHEEEKRRKRQEEQSLYKIRSTEEQHESKTEVELEAEDLEQTFPDYSTNAEAMFADVGRTAGTGPVVNDPTGSGEQKSTVRYASEIPPDTLEEIISIHSEVFRAPTSNLSSSSHNSASLTDAIRSSFSHQRRCTSSLLNAVKRSSLTLDPHVSSAIDQLSSRSHVFDLALLSDQLDVKPADLLSGRKLRKDALPPNLYSEPNIPEVQLLEQPMRGLLSRLKDLLAAYPSHPTLIEIAQMCQRIGEMPLKSPLMQVLAAVELLLKKAEEWQAYAAKHVSIQPELDRLFQLVARWRKLEIDMWDNTLEYRERKLAKRANRSFFHLYDLVFVVPETSSEESFDEYLGSLHEELDRFVLQSNLAEIRPRLRLLESCSRQIWSEASCDFSRGSLSSESRLRIANVLSNITAFYSTKLEVIDAHLEAHKAPLLKSLKDLVKLSKWDLTNYWSLRDSTIKSHRKLTKIARDYEALLTADFGAILAQKAANVAKTDVSLAATHAVSFGRAKQELDSAVQQAQAALNGGKGRGMKRKRDDVDDSKLNSRERRKRKRDEERKATLELNLAVPLPPPSTYLDYLADRSTVSSSTSTSFEALTNVPAYSSRMRAYLEKRVLSSSTVDKRSDLSSRLEGMSVTVIRTCERLNKKGAPVSQKKNALTRMLKQLKANGLSYYLSAVSRFPFADEQGAVSVKSLFQLEPLEPSRYLSSSSSSASSPNAPAQSAVLSCANELSASSTRYFYEGLSKLSQLRMLAKARSADLSADEVTRCKGIAEHLMSLLIDERSTLCSALANHRSLTQWSALLNDLSSDSLSGSKSPPSVSESVDSNESFSASMLGELSTECDRWLVVAAHYEDLYATAGRQLRAAASLVSQEQMLAGLTKVRRFSSALSHTRSCISTCLSICSSRSSSTNPFTESHSKSLDALRRSLSELANLASDLFLSSASDSPTTDSSTSTLSLPFGESLREVSHCLRRWTLRLSANAAASSSGAADSSSSTSVNSSLEKAVNSMLVAFQNAVKSVDGKNKEDNSRLILNEHEDNTKTVRSLYLGDVARALADVSRELSDRPSSMGLHALLALRPLLEQVIALTQISVLNLLRVHKSLCKFEYVYTTLLQSLFVHGFCREPKESEEEGGPGQESNSLELTDGTGLGDGEGANDISKELENEEQILGTKQDEEREKADDADNKKDDKPPPVDEEDDAGVEMDADFEGTMHDMKQPDEQQNEGDKSDGEDDDEEELDRQMRDKGDGPPEDDEDSKVVDQRMWDPEEDGPPDEDEKVERDAPMPDSAADQDDDNTELSAKSQDDIENDDKNSAKDDRDDEPAPKRQKSEERDEQQQEGEEKAEQLEQDLTNEDDEEDGGYDPAEHAPKSMEDQFEDRTNVAVDLPEDFQLEENEDGEEEGDGEDAEMKDADDGEDGGEENEDGEDADGEDVEKPDALRDEDASMDDAEDEATAGVAQEQLEENDDATDGSSTNIQSRIDSESRADGNSGQQSGAAAQGASASANQDDGAGADEEDGEDEKGEEAMDTSAEDSNSAEKDESPQSGSMSQSRPSANATYEETTDGEHFRPLPQQNDSQQQNSPPEDGSQQQQQQRNLRNNDQNWKESNPYRSLGDALKAWKEKLELVDTRDEKTPVTAEDDKDSKDGEDGASSDEKKDGDEDAGASDAPTTGFVEHVGADEDADMQALLPATEDESKDSAPMLPPTMERDVHEDEEDGKGGEDGKDVEMTPDGGVGDEDDKSPDADKADNDEESKEEAASSIVRRRLRPKKRKFEKPSIDADEEDGEDEVGADDGEEGKDEDGDLKMFDDVNNESQDPSLIGTLSTQSPSQQQMDDEVTDQLERARRELDDHYDGRSSSSRGGGRSDRLDGVALWQRFQMLTEDLSTQLCEQLRTILEPNLASKLRGDYRSGKRISMRKVIPYIASQYRKDKIWLRRTKPSQRRYQVMVAIDDSESMVDRKCTRVALEALVSVTRALTQLEIGDLAVVRIGKSVKFLHDFDQPFTDDSGIECVSQFTFSSPRSKWTSFLKKMIVYLERAQSSLPASASSSRMECPQLVFLITDGALQEDRARIARLVRESQARRQMLVAILVDENITKQSIVEFKNSSLSHKPFLEDYPLPHYIVLRDVSHLPDILADALRQWFELLQQRY